MTEFSVRDGQTRVVNFDGEMLAEVNTRRDNGPRWTEQRLYKTLGGMYVLEKIGRSTMVHAPDCADLMSDLPRFQAEYPGRDPYENEFWLHEKCLDGEGDVDITNVVVEENRYWASFAEDPATLVDALYRRKDGARSLQKMSLDLLEEASENDELVAKAYRAEFIL